MEMPKKYFDYNGDGKLDAIELSFWDDEEEEIENEVSGFGRSAWDDDDDEDDDDDDDDEDDDDDDE